MEDMGGDEGLVIRGLSQKDQTFRAQEYGTVGAQSLLTQSTLRSDDQEALQSPPEPGPKLPHTEEDL